MGRVISQINWPTFLVTLFLSLMGGVVSYTNAISEIKQQIGKAQSQESLLLEMISQLKEENKNFRADMKSTKEEILVLINSYRLEFKEISKANKEEMDEIKNLLLTKRQLDDLKAMILGVGINKNK